MQVFGIDINTEQLIATAGSTASKIVIALAIFIVGKWIAKKVVEFVEQLMLKSKLDHTIAQFLSNVLYGLLMVVIMMAALNKVGVDTTSVVAIIGGAAVAIGLALQNQLSNFAAGVLIVLFRPLSRGDYISVNDCEGTVKDITLLNTRLMTLNNHEIIIPNSLITTAATTNYSSLANRRVDVTVGIGYGADIKTAKQIMLDVARQHSLIFSHPEPNVMVSNLGESSVDLLLCVWTSNTDWLQVQCDMYEQIKYALDEHEIEIPFPQRSVHVVGLESILNK